MFCYVFSANFPFMPHKASLKGCYHWISINRNDSVFLRTPPKLSSVTRDNCVKKRKGQHEHLSDNSHVMQSIYGKVADEYINYFFTLPK